MATLQDQTGYAINVDYDLCVGHGKCYMYSPDVLQPHGDEGLAEYTGIPIATGTAVYRAAITAIDSCPERALSLRQRSDGAEVDLEMTLSAPVGPLVLRCPCGELIEAPVEDEIVDKAQAHLRLEHPDLAGKYSREQILTLVQ